MSKGRFGIHGGQYIPETLMNAVIELEEAYNHYKDDPEFNAELTELLNEYAGRPSRLYFASHMTEDLGGAKVYFCSTQIFCHVRCKVETGWSSCIFVQKLCKLCVKLRVIFIVIVGFFQFNDSIHQCFRNVLSSMDAESSF